jgi:hypothetical protein
MLAEQAEADNLKVMRQFFAGAVAESYAIPVPRLLQG